MDSSSPSSEIRYITYTSEAQLPMMTKLIEADLSEPYSVFTFRHFLNNWPDLCFIAMTGENRCVGVIICKLEKTRSNHVDQLRGYIGMLAVDKGFRNQRIGSTLVRLVVRGMREKKADVIVLETECSNSGAIALYEKLDFVRSRRLGKYYLNGGDAYRLKLWLTYPPELLDGGEVAEQQQEQEQQQQPAPEQQISDEERKARMEKRLNEVDAAISASS